MKAGVLTLVLGFLGLTAFPPLHCEPKGPLPEGEGGGIFCSCCAAPDMALDGKDRSPSVWVWVKRSVVV